MFTRISRKVLRVGSECSSANGGWMPLLKRMVRTEMATLRKSLFKEGVVNNLRMSSMFIKTISTFW